MAMKPPTTADPLLIGRYALHDEIAAGGMATVHLGRLLGPVGFSRTVAIKRLHPQFAKDPEFVAMFLDEARLAARIQHPNVVPTLDVVALDHELFLVMEYVQGESLSRVVRASTKREAAAPLPIVTTIMAGVLHGLHAAHEAKTEQGEALCIVHRDVSPQNVLVGIDGVPRVLDFGVAKAAHRAQTTRQGQIKGKMAYMAPEQLKSDHVDRRCDVYAAAVVLWEAVTRKRLYHADTDARLLTMILFEPAPSPRTVVPDLNVELERIIMRGLERDRDKRYATAREMALDLETCLPVASASAIGGWVERMAGDALATRARRITDIESSTSAPRFLAAAEAVTSSPAIATPPPPPGPPALAVATPSSPAIDGAPAAARAPAPSSATLVDPPTAVLPAIEDVAEQAATLSKVTRASLVPEPPQGRRRFLLLGAGAALFLLLGVVVARATMQGPNDSGKPAAASTEPVAAPPLATAAPTPPPALTAAALEPTATASAHTATGSAAPPRKGSPSAPPPRNGATPAAAPARPAGNCATPYTVDAAGFRHVKPECM